MKAILDFIFPMFCLHCDEKTSNPPFCIHCIHHLSVSSDSTTIFDRNPVAELYLKYLKKYQFASHIKTAAAYIVVKLDKLNWPYPEIITADSPLTYAIAKQLSYFLKRRVKKKIPHKKRRVLQIKDCTDEKKDYSIFLLMI